MLPRRPAKARRTSQVAPAGPPGVPPPTEDVGGGVTCGLLVAASTADVGEALGEGLADGLGAVLGDGLGAVLGDGLGELK
jgi:hypothetical protein